MHTNLNVFYFLFSSIVFLEYAYLLTLDLTCTRVLHWSKHEQESGVVSGTVEWWNTFLFTGYK